MAKLSQDALFPTDRGSQTPTPETVALLTQGGVDQRTAEPFRGLSNLIPEQAQQLGDPFPHFRGGSLGRREGEGLAWCHRALAWDSLASAWDGGGSVVSTGNILKREYYSSVLDNRSMTQRILPPDSFQLGGPNTPWARGSPGLPSGCR